MAVLWLRQTDPSPPQKRHLLLGPSCNVLFTTSRTILVSAGRNALGEGSRRFWLQRERGNFKQMGGLLGGTLSSSRRSSAASLGRVCETPRPMLFATCGQSRSHVFEGRKATAAAMQLLIPPSQDGILTKVPSIGRSIDLRVGLV